MKNFNIKYKVGTTVFAKSDPDDALIVSRYAAKTYYCKLADKSDLSELVYFEGELMTIQEKKDSM